MKRDKRFDELADMLDEIGLHYRAIGHEQKGYQYTKASKSVRKADFIPPDPSEIDNVGDAIRDDIAQWRMRGEIDRLEDFREDRPYLSNLCKLREVGPSTAENIYREKNVETIDGVKDLIDDGKLTEISGIGSKTAATIKRSVSNQ